MCTLLRKDITSASNCVDCGKCETHCPQGIKIRDELKNARKDLERMPYKIAKKIVKIWTSMVKIKSNVRVDIDINPYSFM